MEMRVKSMLVELEDGTLIYRESPILSTPVPALPAPVVIDAKVEKPKRWGGRRKAAPKATGTKPSTGRPSTRNAKEICIPLDQCLGALSYQRKDPNAEPLIVAIHKTGKKKDGSPWYLCLFISNDHKWAYGEGWFANPQKIIEIKWFN